MSKLQDILANVLPDSWAASMEAESRGWFMRCPCGAETSVWDMGGVRWKAAGNPVRSGQCGVCGQTFTGQLYQRNGVSPAVSIKVAPVVETETDAAARTQYGGHWLLWIDGVGCWLVVTKDRLTIGGPSSGSASGGAAGLKLLADLARVHATIERAGDAYWLAASGPTSVAQRRCGARSLLHDRDSIGLGQSNAVQLIFRQPNPLSLSARLDFVSGHRPSRRIDGVVLMEQTCLIGPTADCHIVCPDWEQTVILFRRDGKLWCKAAPALEATEPSQLFANGCHVTGDAAVRDGTVVTGQELRFRVEFATEMG